jgi:hypothetical protein
LRVINAPGTAWGVGGAINQKGRGIEAELRGKAGEWQGGGETRLYHFDNRALRASPYPVTTHLGAARAGQKKTPPKRGQFGGGFGD